MFKQAALKFWQEIENSFFRQVLLSLWFGFTVACVLNRWLEPAFSAEIGILGYGVMLTSITAVIVVRNTRALRRMRKEQNEARRQEDTE